MQWADEVKIETPEQIDLSLEIAGIGSRFVAQLYDWLIKWFIVLGLAASLIALFWALDLARMLDQTVQSILVGVFVVIGFLFFYLYDVCYEAYRHGQTPGKKSLAIRVIREGGAPVDFTSALIRNLVGMVDFLPSFYLFGALLALINAKGQRLGDMAAGTLVIRERSDQAPEEPELNRHELATDEFAFLDGHLSRCSPEDRVILRAYCQRYKTLGFQARSELAMRLSSQYLAKTTYEPATPLTDGPRAEAFLLTLYQDLEQRARHE